MKLFIGVLPFTLLLYIHQCIANGNPRDPNPVRHTDLTTAPPSAGGSSTGKHHPPTSSPSSRSYKPPTKEAILKPSHAHTPESRARRRPSPAIKHHDGTHPFAPLYDSSISSRSTSTTHANSSKKHAPSGIAPSGYGDPSSRHPITPPNHSVDTRPSRKHAPSGNAQSGHHNGSSTDPYTPHNHTHPKNPYNVNANSQHHAPSYHGQLHHRPSNGSLTTTNYTGPAQCARAHPYETYSSLPVPPWGGSGPAYASSCNLAWLQYKSSSKAWWSMVAARSTPPPETKTKWTERLQGTVPGATVDPEGYTRAPLGAKSDDFVVTNTQHVWKMVPHPAKPITSYSLDCFKPEQRTKGITTTFPAGRPACHVKFDDCVGLREEAKASGLPKPACGDNAYAYDRCHIFARKVDVYFWPDETEGKTSLNQTGRYQKYTHNNITAGPANTGPRTVTVSGSVLTSPSIYLKLRDIGISITHWTDDTSTITSKQENRNRIMALPPQSLSSVVYKPRDCDGLCPERLASIMNTYQTPLHALSELPIEAQPYNPATFNKHAPPSASQYFWGKVDAGFNLNRAPLTDIWYRPDQHIIYNNYIPEIAVPDEIRDLDPAWKHCGLGIGGIYDPPIALTPVDNIVVPTLTHPRPTSVPPAPGSTGSSGVAQTTGKPKITDTPAPPSRVPTYPPSSPPKEENKGGDNAAPPSQSSSDNGGSLSSDDVYPAPASPHSDAASAPSNDSPSDAPRAKDSSDPAAPPSSNDHSNPPLKVPTNAAPQLNSDILGAALAAAAGKSAPPPGNSVSSSHPSSGSGIQSPGSSEQDSTPVVPPIQVSRTFLRDASSSVTARPVVAHGQTAVAGGRAVTMADGSEMRLSSDGERVVVTPPSASDHDGEGGAGGSGFVSGHSSGTGLSSSDAGGQSQPEQGVDSTPDHGPLSGTQATPKQEEGVDSTPSHSALSSSPPPNPASNFKPNSNTHAKPKPQSYTSDSSGRLVPHSSSHSPTESQQQYTIPATEDIILPPLQTLHASLLPIPTIAHPHGSQHPQQGVVIDGHTLSVGGAAVTIPSIPAASNHAHVAEEAHTISIATNERIIVDGTRTFPALSSSSTSLPSPHKANTAEDGEVIITVSPAHAHGKKLKIQAQATTTTNKAGHTHAAIAIGGSILAAGGVYTAPDGEKITAVPGGVMYGALTHTTPSPPTTTTGTATATGASGVSASGSGDGQASGAAQTPGTAPLYTGGADALSVGSVGIDMVVGAVVLVVVWLGVL